MANTLPANIGDAEKAAEIVGRELVGFIPAMQINSGSEAVALNSSVKSLTTEEPTLNTSVAPSMTIPEGDDQTIGEKSVTISQVANVQMNYTGEEQRELNTNYDFETVNGHRYLRAFRKIVNQIEAHCGATLKNGASRAVGTAGTTPFASDQSAINAARRILVDNGMFEAGNTSLVIDTAAGENFRNLYNLNEMGAASEVRSGALMSISQIDIRESAGVASHTKGTGTSYQTSSAEALKSTTINADTGSGTVVAGDVITFADDSNNKYVVNSDLSGGSFTIGDPGVRSAIADNNAITVGNDYTANVLLNRAAAELVVRPLDAPAEDAATSVFSVQDSISGITFEVRIYGGFHKAMISVTLVYQAKVWETSGVALLLG